MTTEQPPRMGIAELLASVDEFLQLFASAGGSVPDLESRGRSLLAAAWASPDSAWCRY